MLTGAIRVGVKGCCACCVCCSGKKASDFTVVNGGGPAALLVLSLRRLGPSLAFGWVWHYIKEMPLASRY